MESKTKIQTILLPTDFSASSLHAVRRAAQLARSTGARVDLFHVIEDVPPTYAHESIVQIYHEEILPDAQKRLEQLADRELPGIALTRTVVIAVFPADAILRRAHTIGADLIVMGTHGRSGLSHLLHGSVTELVLHEAPCPVMAVGPAEELKAA